MSIADKSDIKANKPCSPCFAFPKNKRLLTSKDFSEVFAGASFKASSQHLLILANKASEPHPRLGLVIAKKNVRFAVDRNRAKRLIRESFRLKQHILPPIDAIVLARRGLDTLDNHEILKVLDKLWTRVATQASKISQ